MSTNLNSNERKVLRFLVRGRDYYCDYDFLYFSFRPIARSTKLKREDVRRACRSLARKGLTQYCRGLWSEDGVPGGAGYSATRSAVEALK